MIQIHPLLNKEKQQLARRYEKEKRALGLASMILSGIILLAFYFAGLSARLANGFVGRPVIWAFLTYVASLMTVWAILGLPLSFYGGYSHEHKWNFSNQTVKSWLLEKLKSFLVSLFIAYMLLGLLFWIMARFPRIWWLITGLAMAFVSVIFATLYPVLIMPIFNKYQPIDDQTLTGALERILAKGGLKSSGFFKEDMSRQTKKENAFLAGLGRTRRVILGDNLMNNMTVPEIESVIAHEVGHYQHKHIWKNIFLGTVEQIIIFWLLNLAMASVFPHFLSSTRWNLTVLPLFAIFASVFSGLFFGPLRLALSRRFESQADRYALENLKDQTAFITAMAGLADRNLSNAYPAWWVKILFYSHPPIGERLRTAEKFIRAESGISNP